MFIPNTVRTLADVVNAIRAINVSSLQFVGFDDFWAALPNLAISPKGWVPVIDEVVLLSERLVTLVEGYELAETDDHYWVWVDCAHDAREFHGCALKMQKTIHMFADVATN